MKIVNAILNNALKFNNNLKKISNALNNGINFYMYKSSSFKDQSLHFNSNIY